METLEANPFSTLKVPSEAEVETHGTILFVKKWNWDYDDCLEFQKQAQELVRSNRSLKVYIFCNHPHVFTLGRGNERGEKNLVEFNPTLATNLKYPVKSIHRGGGITFHYPGQWIFYPIMAITPSYTLDDHMCWLLKSVASVLREDFRLEGVLTAKKLMGVWKDKRKLASIGVGVSRFITEHGLALNLIKDQEMFDELGKINPCGMSHETYESVDSYVQDNNLIENFHNAYLKSFSQQNVDIRHCNNN